MDVTPKIKQQLSIDDARKIGKMYIKWCNVKIIRKKAPNGANILKNQPIMTTGCTNHLKI